MAWKASSTPLFVVWALQKHGNFTRPAQHAKFLVSHRIHISCVSQAKITEICAHRHLWYHHLPSQHCSTQSIWNIPIWRSVVLWNTITSADSLKKKWPNKAEIGGWNLCLWQKYSCILHLRSSYLRSLNTKKGFKQEQGEDFSQWKVSSQTMVTNYAYWHNCFQNIRETSLFQHWHKTLFMRSQLLGSKDHLPLKLEVSSMAISALFLGKYRRKWENEIIKGNSIWRKSLIATDKQYSQ